MVLTDPPYGIGLSKNAGLSDKYTNKNWDKERPPKQMFDEIIRVSKHQIIFGGNYFVDLLLFGSWAVWDKRCGVIPQRTFADGELIWVSYKKPLRIFCFIWDGMLQDDMKNKEIRFHLTQKPVKLLERILSYYADIKPPAPKSGFLVADFFGGNCSTAITFIIWGLILFVLKKMLNTMKKA